MEVNAIIGFISPDRPIATADVLNINDGYFRFRFPDPEFEARVAEGALAAWHSEVPIAWHPYQHLQLCDINGAIIPGNNGLPLNAYIALSTNLPDGHGGTIQQNNGLYVFMLQQYIHRIFMLNPDLAGLLNFGRNGPPRFAGFNLQEATRVATATHMPQPYMFYNNNQVPPNLESKEDFKIHLCPRPEYNYWVLFQLIKFAMYTQRGPNGIYKLKFCIPSRPHNLRSDDSFLIQLDGGSSPGIIIYITGEKVQTVNSVNQYVQTYLRYIKMLDLLFAPLVEDIGNITERVKLPFGNVRYNQLIAYASGTRAYKLNILDGIERNPQVIALFNTPVWVTDLCRRATNNNANSISTIKQLFYKNICEDNEKNVLQLARSPLPDPRTISVSVPDVTEGLMAGVKAIMNSFSVGAPGFMRFIGGKRRKRSRRTRRTRRRNINR